MQFVLDDCFGAGRQNCGGVGLPRWGHTGPGLGIERDWAAEIKLRGMGIARIRRGAKVQETWDNWDRMAMFEQIDAAVEGEECGRLTWRISGRLRPATWLFAPENAEASPSAMSTPPRDLASSPTQTRVCREGRVPECFQRSLPRLSRLPSPSARTTLPNTKICSVAWPRARIDETAAKMRRKKSAVFGLSRLTRTPWPKNAAQA